MDLGALFYILFVFFHLPVQLWQWSWVSFLHFVFCICSIAVYLQTFVLCHSSLCLFCTLLIFLLFIIPCSLVHIIIYSILATSFFTYAETVQAVFLKSFVTGSLHALHLLLKLTFYFCFLEAVIIPSNKHTFIAGTISLHLAPRSFPLCPPSSNLPVSSRGKWIMNVPSEKTSHLPTLLFCIKWPFPLEHPFILCATPTDCCDVPADLWCAGLVLKLCAPAWCHSLCARHRLVLPRD